jgi:hypothetical protein
MLLLNEPWDVEGVWSPYTPDARAPWDLRRVVHLHRRAGFGATWGELQRDLKDGPGPSIDRLLTGNARSQEVPEHFEQVARALADRGAPDSPRTLGPRRLATEYSAPLEAWWVYRCRLAGA